MKNLFNTLAVLALIAMLFGVFALAYHTVDQVPTDSDDKTAEMPGKTEDENDLPQDPAEAEPDPYITVKAHCTVQDSCDCADPLVYTIPIQEGDTWNTLWERIYNNYDQYASAMSQDCDYPTPDFCSLAGAYIQNTTTTITDDTVLESGTVYVLYAQPTFFYQSQTMYFDDGMTWYSYCEDKGLNIYGFYVDFSSERILYSDGYDTYYLAYSNGSAVVFTETIGVDAEYQWGGTV